MIVCKECGSDKVFQKGEMLIPINVSETTHTFIDFDDITLFDYFWCARCQSECESREAENNVYERPLDTSKYGDMN